MDVQWYQWYFKVIKKYAVFKGRASRSEYWYFVLISVIISALIYILMPLLWILYSLFIILPSIAVTVRRLHDIGKSGWWILIDLIPIVGFIVLLVFEATDSQPGSNKFGENPKGINSVTANNDTIKSESVNSISTENTNNNITDFNQDYKFCPKCGYKNDILANYCKQCGEKL